MRTCDQIGICDVFLRVFSHHPLFNTLRIQDGLCSCECFGVDEDECLFHIKSFSSSGDINGVDIGQKSQFSAFRLVSISGMAS